MTDRQIEAGKIILRKFYAKAWVDGRNDQNSTPDLDKTINAILEAIKTGGESSDEGKIERMIRTGIFYKEECAGVTGIKITLVGFENVVKAICARFASPVVSKEKIIAILVKHIDFVGGQIVGKRDAAKEIHHLLEGKKG